MNRSTALRVSAASLPLLAALAVFACSDVTGLSRVGRVPSASIAFNPVFQSDAGGVVQFTKVRIILHRTDGGVALDTLVNFPAGADQIDLQLAVTLAPTAPLSGEDFSLNFQMLDAAGDVVFTGGPVTVHAQQGTPLPPVNVPATYVGPGATATRVVVSPATVTVIPLTGVDFTATAFDASNTPLPGTPVQWTSLNPSVISFADPAVGHAVAGAARGTATVRATLVTGQTADAAVTVQPLPAAIVTASGGGQTGTVGTPLAQPLTAKVTAADGLGVSGVTVAFAVVSGGGSISAASVTTDAQGLASTTFTVGPLAGPATISASASGLAGSPVIFTATGSPAAATQLAFSLQPVNGSDGASFGVVVQARDAFNNVATSYTGTVAVALDAPPPGVTLQGTASIGAVAGVATFSALKISGSATGLHLRATGASITGSVASTAFDITSSPATQLFLLTPPVQKKTFQPDHIVVQARTAQGAVDPGFTGTLQMSLATAPPNSVFTVAGSLAFVAGVATVDLTFTVPGSYQLVVAAGGLPPIVSSPFVIVTSAPANLILSGNNQNAGPGAALPSPLAVVVTDGGGDPVAGVTVTWSIVSGGGAVTPATSVTGADGSASTTWRLGTGGAQAVQASAAGLPPVLFSATFTAGLGQIRTWTGTVSTIFDNPNNWSPVGVPGTLDDVVINPGTPNVAEISAPEAFHNLTVNANGVLEVDPVLVTLTGNMMLGDNAILGAPFAGIRAGIRSANTAALKAGGAAARAASLAIANQVVNFGNVALAGAGTSITQGANVVNDANIFIDDQVSAGSDLLLDGGLTAEGTTGVFDVSGFHVTTNADFETVSGGRLSMGNAAGILEVFGDVSFAGGSTTGLLTAGQLIAHNGFTQIGDLTGANPGSFARAGNPLQKSKQRDPRALAMMARARKAYLARHPASGLSARDQSVAAHRANAMSARVVAAPPKTVSRPVRRRKAGVASVVLDPNFYQDSYAPSGTHTTVLEGADGAEISFNTANASHFQNVVFDNGDWSSNGDVFTLGNATFAPTAVAELDGIGQFSVVGVTTANPMMFVDISTVVLYHNMVGAGFMEPDDLILPAGGTYVISQVTNPGLNPLEIDVLGDASLVPGETVTIESEMCVHLNGTLDINGATLNVTDGDFVTLDSGRLIMDGASDVINLGGGLDFEGGSSVMSNGAIHVLGSVFQGDGAADGLAASGANVITFGAIDGGMFFTNPGSGAGTSHFANINFDDGPSDVAMESPVFVTGVMAAQDGIGTVEFSGAQPLTVQGTNVPSSPLPAAQTVLLFNNTPVTIGIAGLPDLAIVFNNAIFENFDDSGATQLRLNRSAGTYNLSNLQFNTPCNASFQYIFGHDGGAGPTYNIVNPIMDTTPANGCTTTIGQDGAAQVIIVIT